jgi:hypothetical protein
MNREKSKGKIRREGKMNGKVGKEEAEKEGKGKGRKAQL